jgi:hypothetical protein
MMMTTSERSIGGGGEVDSLREIVEKLCVPPTFLTNPPDVLHRLKFLHLYNSSSYSTTLLNV